MGYVDEGIIQGAFSISNHLNLDRVIRTVDIAPFCQDRRCRIMLDHRLLPPETWFDVVTGASVRVRIEPLEPPVEQVLDFESLTLMQTSFAFNSLGDDCFLMQQHTGLPWMPRRDSANPAVGMNPLAPAFTPGLCNFYQQSDFVHDLHEVWQEHAFSWEGEAHSTKILTWFLDHRLSFPKKSAPRPITLFDDFAHWEERIRRAWSDELDSECPVDFSVVSPAPPLLEPGFAAHVIMIAAPREDWVSVLVSALDPHMHAHPVRTAITLHEQVSFEDIVRETGAFCSQVLPLCQAWFGPEQIRPGLPIPGRSGYSIVLQVR